MIRFRGEPLTTWLKLWALRLLVMTLVAMMVWAFYLTFLFMWECTWHIEVCLCRVRW